jgi:hypothetical protein
MGQYLEEFSLLYFLKEEIMLMRSPCCLCVSSLSTLAKFDMNVMPLEATSNWYFLISCNQ